MINSKLFANVKATHQFGTTQGLVNINVFDIDCKATVRHTRVVLSQGENFDKDPLVYWDIFAEKFIDIPSHIKEVLDPKGYTLMENILDDRSFHDGGLAMLIYELTPTDWDFPQHYKISNPTFVNIDPVEVDFANGILQPSRIDYSPKEEGYRCLTWDCLAKFPNGQPPYGFAIATNGLITEVISSNNDNDTIDASMVVTASSSFESDFMIFINYDATDFDDCIKKGEILAQHLNKSFIHALKYVLVDTGRKFETT